MNPNARKPRVLLVAIAGGSGSGKTWLADRLEKALAPNAARLSLDDFYRDRSHLSPARRARINFDSPRAIDWRAVEKVVRALARGRSARVPRYDFKTHSRQTGPRCVPARPILLMEGLWLLRRRSLRSLFQWRIFIDCPTRTRLRRRLRRDQTTRGRTEASIRAQFRTTVEPMHRLYVAPQSRYAHLVIAKTCSPQQAQRLAQQIRAGIGPN